MKNEIVFNLALNLANAIKTSESYENYTILKSKINENPQLLKQINEFRSAHLDFQTKLLQNISPTFQEEIHVSKLYSELILNDDARLFLENERESLNLLLEIQNIISNNCKIDMDF